MITSKDNEKLKLIRRLGAPKGRQREDMFVAEGEDLVEAAAAAGAEPVFVLRAEVDVEPALLDSVSALGSGTRVIGVYRRPRTSDEGGLRVQLYGVTDPGNVGTIIRTAHALADAPVVAGPGCADPYGPRSVRAAMGSIFARPPLREAAAGAAGGRARRPRGRAARHRPGRDPVRRGRAPRPAA